MSRHLKFQAPALTLISGALASTSRQRKVFGNILRKIDFCAQNIFLRKSTQIWGDKTDLSKKK